MVIHGKIFTAPGFWILEYQLVQFTVSKVLNECVLIEWFHLIQNFLQIAAYVCLQYTSVHQSNLIAILIWMLYWLFTKIPIKGAVHHYNIMCFIHVMLCSMLVTTNLFALVFSCIKTDQSW